MNYSIYSYYDNGLKIWFSECLDLFGFKVEGSTQHESIFKLETKIEEWLKISKANGNTIPEPENSLEKLRKENNILRGLVAKLEIPCVYCGLDNMTKCAFGFPGCARADDLMVGEDETFKRLLEENRELKKKI